MWESPQRQSMRETHTGPSDFRQAAHALPPPDPTLYSLIPPALIAAQDISAASCQLVLAELDDLHNRTTVRRGRNRCSTFRFLRTPLSSESAQAAAELDQSAALKIKNMW